MTGSELTAQAQPKNETAPLSAMMRQYLDIKSQNPDALLFFRVGDFYELFDEDAHVAARELEITLTGRPEPSYPNGRMPMAGIPVKAYEAYIGRLINKGYSVAVCEQVGVPGATKGPMERQISRILTPGTVLESNLLPSRESNYLVAIQRSSDNGDLWGLAAVDASCAEFLVSQMPEDKLLLELGRLAPKEILVPKKTVRSGPHGLAQEVFDAPPVISERYRLTGRPSMFFHLEPSKRRIMQNFGVTTLEGFGCHEMPLAIGAAGAALEYLERTQAALMPKFSAISTYSTDDYLVIDDNARRNLELTETVRDRSFEGSLLWCIDKTKTGMGSRLLRNWLLKPLLSAPEIQQRQEAIEELLSDSTRRRKLEASLSQLSDLERLSVRLTSGTVNPRDLTAIAVSIKQIPALSAELKTCHSNYLKALQQTPADLLELADKIESSLCADPPREINNGGIFADSYSAELAEVRSLLGGGKQWIEDFQKREQERSQIKSLKVSFNSNFGYYIEITHANKNLVPEDYIRKQTLTNAERYITPELKEYEAKILNAEKNQAGLEYRLYVEFRNELSPYGLLLKEQARHLAGLDVLLSLATAAAENRYTRPVVDESLVLEIEAGRHPVLEKILPMGVYVANDTHLYGQSDEQQMIILTGPNMAGKSSILRQTAHIVILAQIGSYVPASKARVGLVDRIFTRIGAVDDLNQGQSTFLVEMSETTQCCVCATARSLVLLDEVGRGTSTYDGVAIAWAVSEYLATTVQARTIFATHYHELNGLASFLPQVSNFQVQIAESEGTVEFLHRVVPGGASRSFGVHVASMAGLPSPVIDRANYLMNQMEKRSAARQILNGPKLRSIPLDEVMQLSVFTPGEGADKQRV
ncbi:MAG: DNA mismatch repair protein MutS [Candidatus Obscuribacterales bacterium]|nr:DNA mismatch repair protein MutS [Candidatus Obscuribacterales bacterium]